MILYLDASALVKRYVTETGSTHVRRAIARARLVGTAVVSRAEVGAALARAVRTGALSEDDGELSIGAFRSDWPALIRLPVSESVIVRADLVAWEHGLRGYDAVQLAAALHWRDLIDAPVTMATFDRRLWEASGVAGLGQLPEDLTGLLGSRD